MSLAPPASRRSIAKSAPWIACLTLFAAVALLQAGCLGLAANLMHAVGADMIPAEYEGFEEKTVAVVTLTDSSQYTSDIAARELSARVSEILLRNISDMKLVRDDKIDQWIDINGFEEINFEAIGEGVEADKVLGIELSNLRLTDGATLYRGRADVTVSVIDVATGAVEYKRALDEFTYPQVAGQYTSETTEARFRKLYLRMLSEEIGRSFHPYDFSDTIAMDSVIAR